MTIRWRVRYWLAWYLLRLVEWLAPTTHLYTTSGNLTEDAPCQKCHRPFREVAEPCRPLPERTFGFKPRLRRAA